MNDINKDGSAEPPELLEKITGEALEAQATDIHLEHTKTGLSVKFRIDGRLVDRGDLKTPAADRLPTLVKYLAKLKTYLHRRPQDGEIDGAKFGFRGRVRVSVYPTVEGEKVALRIFDEENRSFRLESLNLPGDYLATLKRELSRPEGLLLFTGPAGSGKTTTIYSSINYIREHGRTNILTIEDPVEARLEGVTQTAVDRAAGLDFPDALRFLLRQDPEVIAVGEIRDENTARITLRAAFTGHLGLSAIHAGSVVSVFVRLLEMQIEPFLLTSALRLVTAQRLLRKLCPECRGEGCERCLQSGYKGRLPLVEYVVVDEDIRERIKNCRSEKSLLEYLIREKSFCTLAERAKDLIEVGETDASEVQRVLGPDSLSADLRKGKGMA